MDEQMITYDIGADVSEDYWNWDADALEVFSELEEVQETFNFGENENFSHPFLFDEDFSTSDVFEGLSMYSDNETSEILNIYADEDYITETEVEVSEDTVEQFITSNGYGFSDETKNGFFDWFCEPTLNDLEGSIIKGEIEAISYDEEFILHDIDEVDSWLDDINPNYDPYDLNDNYENNCGSCSFAVFNRLEGNDNVVATENNIGYNSQMEALTGLTQESMSPEEIEDYLTDLGPGSHGIVGVDRAYGPGHWFNAYYDGEQVYAIDGQTGEIYNWPPDYGNVVNWELSVM